MQTQNIMETAHSQSERIVLSKRGTKENFDQTSKISTTFVGTIKLTCSGHRRKLLHQFV